GAGQVIDGYSETTNLPWVIDARQLAGQLGLASVALINDLEANAYGVAALAPEDFAVLNPGAPGVQGNAAIIAAGTGLGEAGFYWDGARHHPLACQGGPARFAPPDQLEAGLLPPPVTPFPHLTHHRRGPLPAPS